MITYIQKKLKGIWTTFKWYGGTLYYFYIKLFKVVPFDTSFYEGKSVAIIGPADSIKDQANGEYIDTFDLVIRINKGIYYTDEIPEYVGRKTDILFHGGSEELCGEVKANYFKSKGLKSFVYGEFPQLFWLKRIRYKSLYKKLGAKLVFHQVPRHFYEGLMRKVNDTYPTTGFVALCNAIDSKASKIFITGFTFYRTPYLDSKYSAFGEIDHLERFRQRNWHKPDFDFEYFKHLYVVNSHRIELDRRLKMILEEEGVLKKQ